MTKHYALSAAKRERAGKGVARTLRREAQIPAVIYGDAKEAVSISLPVKDITLEYHKGHMFTNLCDLEVDGQKHLVLVRDVQLDPVTDRILHADFLRVSPKTTITVHVPVHFTGEDVCPGLKIGGTLNIVRHDLEMVCLATNIPESIEVDLSSFEIGDAVKLSDAKLPAGAKSPSSRDITIATIAVPRKLLEEEDAENAAKTDAATVASEEAAAGAAPAAGAAAPAKEEAKK